MHTITLHSLPVSREQFLQICEANQDLLFERTASGELVIVPPTGGETGDRNDEISFQLRAWNKQTRTGKTFNAATGFELPNGADRSPDASWVRLDRWEALTPEQRTGFPPICPDFVIELRSPSDRLKDLQAKMREYIENGAQLGWLINPQSRQVEIYRPSQETQILENPETVSGEDVLPGFVLNLKAVLE